MTAITGNTYPVKTQLRDIGGRWDAGQKAWMVPDERADEARKIVAGAGVKSRPSYSRRGESIGQKYSRYDKGGLYTADGRCIGRVSCGCEDYPCCGH